MYGELNSFNIGRVVTEVFFKPSPENMDAKWDLWKEIGYCIDEYTVKFNDISKLTASERKLLSKHPHFLSMPIVSSIPETQMSQPLHNLRLEDMSQAISTPNSTYESDDDLFVYSDLQGSQIASEDDDSVVASTSKIESAELKDIVNEKNNNSTSNRNEMHEGNNNNETLTESDIEMSNVLDRSAKEMQSMNRSSCCSVSDCNVSYYMPESDSGTSNVSGSLSQKLSQTCPRSLSVSISAIDPTQPFNAKQRTEANFTRRAKTKKLKLNEKVRSTCPEMVKKYPIRSRKSTQ